MSNMDRVGVPFLLCDLAIPANLTGKARVTVTRGKRKDVSSIRNKSVKEGKSNEKISNHHTVFLAAIGWMYWSIFS